MRCFCCTPITSHSFFWPLRPCNPAASLRPVCRGRYIDRSNSPPSNGPLEMGVKPNHPGFGLHRCLRPATRLANDDCVVLMAVSRKTAVTTWGNLAVKQIRSLFSVYRGCTKLGALANISPKQVPGSLQLDSVCLNNLASNRAAVLVMSSCMGGRRSSLPASWDIQLHQSFSCRFC